MNYSKRIYFKEHLWTSVSKTPVRDFLFNDVASLMAWRPLLVLEKDSSTGIFLWILCNFQQSFFVEQPLGTTSRMMFIIIVIIFIIIIILQISEDFSLKSVYLMKQWQLRRRNSNARLILCSYVNQVETSLWSCGHTCTDWGTPINEEVEEKEEQKNLL